MRLMQLLGGEIKSKFFVKKSMHEVSRRILSTLLRKIDSFESNSDTLLICATNRKDDMDRAILSRIDLR